MKNPNIVIVIADDAGKLDFNCYNSQSPIPTPNIDRVAKEGVKFNMAYAPGSVCTQTRYGLISGQYHFKTRRAGKGVIFDYTDPLIKKCSTIQSFLKNEGYKTYCSGKWHLGINWKESEEEGDGQFRNEAIDFKSRFDGPTEFGFDEYYGIRASLDHPPYCFLQNGRVVGYPSKEKENYYGKQRLGPSSSLWDDELVDKRIAEKSLSYISQGYHSDKPFFLYVPTSAPHIPWIPTRDMKNSSNSGLRGDMVFTFDWVVGQIVEQLKRLEIFDNTLLIVASDHGPRPDDSVSYDPTGSLKGEKGDLYEGGIRIPLLISYPDRFAPKQIDTPVSLIDIFPTVQHMLCSKISDNLSGNSLYNLLISNEKFSSRRVLFFEEGGGRLAVRKGRWKYIEKKETDELYDIIDDPNEEEDLFDEKDTIKENMISIIETELSESPREF